MPASKAQQKAVSKYMKENKEQLTTMVDCLPEDEQMLILEIMKKFLPDDIATPEDIADIEQARKEYAAGETVPHNAVNWD